MLLNLRNTITPLLLSSCLCLAAPALGTNGIPSVAPHDAIEAGRAAIARKEFVQAANIFEQAVLAHPQDSALNRYLGIGYYKSGRHDAAIRQLHRALTLKPDDADTHYALGVVHLARATEVSLMKIRRVLKESTDHLQKAIDLNPDHAAAHYYLIQVLLNAPRIAGGDQERANQLNERLAELSPLHHKMVNSTLAAKREDVATAEAILLATVERHPDSSLVNFALLSHYSDQEQYGKAIPYGEKFLAIPKTWDDTDLANAHFLLGKAYQAEGNQQQSLQHLAMALTHTENPRLVEKIQKAVREITGSDQSTGEEESSSPQADTRS
jgi:tetratricopeptide (TPR) repeat protein